MKERETFFEAMDTLQANGVQPVAAAYFQDRELEAVGVTGRLLKAWRSIFYDAFGDRRLRPTKAAGQKVKGALVNVSQHIAHARNGH